MEYQCYDLDLNFKLYHGENPVLFETNCIGEAYGFIDDRWKTTGAACAIFHPKSDGYRGWNLPKPTDGQPREKNGRFGRRTTKE